MITWAHIIIQGLSLLWELLRYIKGQGCLRCQTPDRLRHGKTRIQDSRLSGGDPTLDEILGIDLSLIEEPIEEEYYYEEP